MLGLSSELAGKCRDIFQRCTQFHNDDSLRAVFVVKELLPFRDGLPKFVNRDDYINTTMSYLLEQTDSDQPVFLIFIRELQLRCPQGSLHGDLVELRRQVESELNPRSKDKSVYSLKVPYVVAAMNTSELTDFNSGNYLDIFKEFLPDLPPDWSKHYYDSRDDWRLHSDPEKPIAEVIRTIFEMSSITGESCSEDFFNPEKRGRLWLDLQNSTGILVIDAISLFYRPLFEVIKDTGIASGARMAVLIFSPVFHKLRFTHTVREMLETTIAKDTAHICLQDYCSGKYEIGAWNLFGVQRWLYTTLPGVVDSVKQHNQARNTQIVFGSEPPRHGVYSTMYGRGQE